MATAITIAVTIVITAFFAAPLGWCACAFSTMGEGDLDQVMGGWQQRKEKDKRIADLESENRSLREAFTSMAGEVERAHDAITTEIDWMRELKEELAEAFGQAETDTPI